MATFVWAAASAGNWSVGSNWKVGGVTQSSPPGSGDTAQFGTGSGFTNVNCTLDTSETVLTVVVNAAGYTATLTFATGVTLTVAGTTFTFGSGMTFTRGSGTTIAFSASSASTVAITTAAKVLPAVTTASGLTSSSATYQLQDNMTIGSGVTWTHNAGTLDTNNKTFSVGGFSSSNSNNRTLKFGSSAITLTGTLWTTDNTTGLTISANTATITSAVASTGFLPGAINYNGTGLTFTGGGVNFGATGTATGTATFASLSVTGTATKNDTFTTGLSITTTGNMTFNGNTTTQRLDVISATIGTSHTLTCNGTVTCTNIDFQDTTGAGTGSWNLASVTGLSGDMGGNSGITFTTSQDQYWIGGTATWTTSATNWSQSSGGTGNGRVPLAQDNVHIDNGSSGGTSGKTLTVAPANIGKNLDFTGFLGTATFNQTNSALFGNLTLASGMTLSASSTVVQLEGRGAQTITTHGLVVSVEIQVLCPGGSYTFQDAFTSSVSTVGILVTAGTFSDGGQTVGTSATGFYYQQTGGTANLSGTWTLATQGTISLVWQVTGGTVNGSSSTIILPSSSNARSFQGGGGTYGTLTYTAANSSGGLTITGNNTFATVNFQDGTVARTLTLGTTTTTVTTGWNVWGVSGHLITVTGTGYTINAFTTNSDYVAVDHCTWGTGTWYAGANSTNNGSNSNVTFGQPGFTTTDTGTGADTTTAIAVNNAETGSATDASSEAVNNAETGTGADATTRAGVTGPETGSGADTTTGVGGSTSETGSGADAATGAAAVTTTESGAGVDAQSLGAAASDVGASADAQTLATSVAATETGSGADATARVATAALESGASADAATAVAAVTAAEVGTGAEGATIGVFGAEAGAGADATTVKLLLIVAEVGAGDDTATVAVLLATAETGAGVDAAAVVLGITTAELGAGTDSAVASIVAAAIIVLARVRPLAASGGRRSTSAAGGRRSLGVEAQ